MPGYPNLFPTGWVEYEKDSCSGPVLYRSQPGRETPGITQLNEVVSKYGNTQYKGGDFLRLASNLKSVSRMWDKLPNDAKKDFLRIIIGSNSGLADSVIESYLEGRKKDMKPGDEVEYFGEPDSESPTTPTGSPTGNNKMSILIIVVVAIVAVVIGYLISCAAK